jgi:hypothetical protein
MRLCESCNEKESQWVCIVCGKKLCDDCITECDTCESLFCKDCVSIHGTKRICSICKNNGIHIPISKDDLIHHMEELAELIQALSKWAKGRPNFYNIKEEVDHVQFVINNLKEHLEREEE